MCDELPVAVSSTDGVPGPAGARKTGGRHGKGRPRPFGQPVGSPRIEARQRRPSQDRARQTAVCVLIRQFAAHGFLSVFRIGRARHRKALVDLRLLIPESRFPKIFDSRYFRVPGGAVSGSSPQQRGWRRGEFPAFPQ